MKLSFADERVLAVMAHPDDAELLCAGALARAKADGAAIGIVVMCRGDKGAGSATKTENLDQLRHDEAAAAASVIGATLFWFGGGDGELLDSLENRRSLIEIYRRFRPTLAIAHAVEDYHPDHRAASIIAEAATWLAASRGHVTASPALDAPPKLWFADTLNMAGFAPEFFLNVGDQLEMKKRMLACHRSQLERGSDGDFAPLMDLMLRQAAARGAQAGVVAAEAFRWHHALKRVGAF
ncbi:MAG: N-acetylglucosamine malate deacetylase 1 [Humisphaera sp.]|nr:N-acetylglucosamine malate deacetylase 1 [Humisphaera sp.]